MSCNEWTHGQVILPAAEVSKFWSTLVDAVNAESQRKYDAAQAFWKSLTRKQQTDADEYIKALHNRNVDTYDLNLPYPYRAREEKPRRAKKTDYQWPTKTTSVLHDSDLSISLDRQTRTVTYNVGENNHAREHAEQSALGRAWERAIREVRWTHGTGGVLLGNDEYNIDGGSEYAGGGGSYVVAAYGYIGAKEQPGHVSEFQTTKGWMHVETTGYSRNGLIKATIKAGRKPISRPARYW